jgi:hypothetical protein
LFPNSRHEISPPTDIISPRRCCHFLMSLYPKRCCKRTVSFRWYLIIYCDFYSPFFQFNCCLVPQLVTGDILAHRDKPKPPLLLSYPHPYHTHHMHKTNKVSVLSPIQRQFNSQLTTHLTINHSAIIFKYQSRFLILWFWSVNEPIVSGRFWNLGPFVSKFN